MPQHSLDALVEFFRLGLIDPKRVLAEHAPDTYGACAECSTHNQRRQYPCAQVWAASQALNLPVPAARPVPRGRPGLDQ